MARLVDLVEREAVKDAIGFMNLHFLGHGENKSLLDSINEVPSVDAVPVVHGQWEQGDYYDIGDVCSVCDWDCFMDNCNWSYCPNCGAKMDGERRKDK